MTGEEVVKVLSVLTAAYPQTEMSSETAKVYTMFLRDIPFEVGKAAAFAHISTSKWFPSIAELRQCAMELTPGFAVPSPEEAWGDVMHNMRRIGSYAKPHLTSSVTQEVVDSMGWRDLCESQNTASDRAFFIRLFTQFADKYRQKYIDVPVVQELRSGSNPQLTGETDAPLHDDPVIAEIMARRKRHIEQMSDDEREEWEFRRQVVENSYGQSVPD